jgi:hypothetical protein
MRTTLRKNLIVNDYKRKLENCADRELSSNNNNTKGTKIIYVALLMFTIALALQVYQLTIATVPM